MGEKPREELLTSLRDLYYSLDYSDLVIFSKDGTRHPVHRAIVCPRSQYLAIAVKQGHWRDGNDGHLALTEDEPEVVRHLVEYLYLLDYDPPGAPSADNASSHGDSSGRSSDRMSVRTDAGQYGHVYGTSAVSAFGGPQSSLFSGVYRNRTESALTVHAIPGAGDMYNSFGPPISQRRGSNRSMATTVPEASPLATDAPCLTLHARMYSAGHKYGIDGLKALALDKFKIQLTRHWDSPELAEAIHIVYNTTPSSDKDMREAIADTLDWRSRLLEKPEIEFAIMDINGLAYELLKRAKRPEPEYMG